MPNQLARGEPQSVSARDGFSAAVRAAGRLVDGRILGMFVVWLAIAFVLRPVLISAHSGAEGALLDALRARMETFSLARAVGVVEWLSFALAVGLTAVLHVRWATLNDASAGGRGGLVWAATYAVVLPVAFIVFLWNQSSVITLMAHDTFIFVDAVHRIQAGQTPSVDFHTPIGVSALYGPALGAWLAGGYAGSVEIASALVALFLGLACAWVCAGRLPSGVASVLVVLVFVAVTPMGLLGDWPGKSATLVGGQPFLLTDQLTHAMFYNRWGWGALIVAFLFLAPRRENVARISEIAVFAVLLAFLFYLKLSYFVVATGAAGAYALLNDRPVRTLAIGGGGALGLILLIGVPGGILFGYLSEVASAASISGNRLHLLAPVLRGGMLPILLSLTVLVVIALVDGLKWQDWLVSGVVLIGSLFIINQNAQTGAICSLIALSAYGVARMAQADAERGARLVVLGVFAMLAAPPVLERMTVLMDRSTAIRREEVRPQPEWARLPALQRFHISERESGLALISAVQTPDERSEALGVLGAMGRRQELRQGEYMTIVLDGLDDLGRVIRPGESVVTVDMSNPFSALLDARPAEGDWLSLHHDRTFSETVHPDAGTIFADADHVMIAKLSMLQTTADLADELYGEWLSANYPQRAETRYWVRYSRISSPSTQGIELRGFSSVSTP